MSHEEMQGAESEKRWPTIQSEPLRAGQAAAVERDHYATLRISQLGDDMRDLQLRLAVATKDILNLEASLAEGGKHIMQSESPKLRELALKLGRDMHEKMASRQEEKEGLEKALVEVTSEIKQLGGNPSDYTVQ